MKNRGIVILACFLCLMTGCGKADKLSNYEEGVKALEESKYEDAAGSFGLSAAENKKAAESYRGEGIAYLKQSNLAEAITSFQSALEHVDSKKEALKKDILFYLASAQYRAENYQDTLGTCDRILEMGSDKKAYFLRGAVNLYLNSYEETSADFDKVIAKSTDYEDYLNIFRVYQEHDMKADGDKFLEKALEITGKDSENALNRGRVYYYLEDYDNAKKQLTKSLNEGNKEAALFLGKVYVALDDISNARAMYQQYLDDKDKSAKGYNGLAYCDIADGKYDSALENIQKGLDLNEEEEKQGLLYNEVIAYEKKLDYATAKAKLAEYIARYPEDEVAVKENVFLQTR